MTGRDRDRAETVRVYQQIRDQLARAAYGEDMPDTPLLEPELEHYDDPQVVAYAHMPVTLL
jgi:hypothetical protein